MKKFAKDFTLNVNKMTFLTKTNGRELCQFSKYIEINNLINVKRFSMCNSYY